MELEITDFHSTDVPNVWEWTPSSLEDVCFDLTVEVSEKGVRGGNLFYLLVAPPEGLRAEMNRYEKYAVPDRGLLMFSHYDWQSLQDRLGRILSHCARDDWDQSVSCLQRYFPWEYEDLVVDDTLEDEVELDDEDLTDGSA